jgi:prepilin-type N-terminal cleavage/methylation domain-containing protein
MPKVSRKKEKGFTMIELIVTLVVLSFGVIGLYNAFIPIIFLTYTISSRFTAAYLAQEGVEIVRNLRDNNFIRRNGDGTTLWSDGLTNCTLGCQADYKTGTSAETLVNQLKPYDPTSFLKINTDGLYGYDDGAPTLFTRKIIISQDAGDDTLKVDVQVLWNYNGKPYTYETAGYIYNWY